jgi:Pectate lyase superfamily protein/Right handed beta helix region
VKHYAFPLLAILLVISGFNTGCDSNPRLSASHRGIVNVRDCGAKGDGVTDDAAAIQKAIAALPQAGGTVMAPAGTYMLGTSAGGVEFFPDGQPIENAIIINKSNVLFKGAGQSTILKIMPHTKMRAIAITGSHVTIEGIVVDGNKSQRNPGTGWPSGDVVDGLLVGDQVGNHITVQDCEVRNGIEDGIGFWKSDDATVQNCYDHDNGIPGAGGSGFSLSGGARAKAIGNRSENNTIGMWSAFGSRNTMIENNTIKNNLQEGIVIGGFTVMNGAGDNRGFIVNGNTLEGNGAAGFAALSIASASDGNIRGNTIINNAFDGIQLSDDGTNICRGWTIQSNTCSNTTAPRVQKYGIRVLGKSTAITLERNTFEDNGQSINDQVVIADAARINSDWKTANKLVYRTKQ